LNNINMDVTNGLLVMKLEYVESDHSNRLNIN
jgi:hypothetical protein